MWVLSMLPASCIELMPKDLEKVTEATIKGYVTIMDFMTDEGKQKMLFIWFYFLHGARAITIESNSFFFS